LLAQMSWDKTVQGMLDEIERCGSRNIAPPGLAIQLEPQERA
jgi:hypothetical protein